MAHPPHLTRAAEARLVAEARAGSRPALDAILASLDRLIIAQARRYRGLGVDVADLAQEARLRVAQCALDPSGWDPARGTRFATYACTAARRRCYEVTLDAGAAVRVGRTEQRRVWREGGEAEARLRRARRALSGDRETARGSLFERLPCPAPAPDEALSERRDGGRLAAAVRAAVGRLGAQQRAVARMRWLPPDGEEAPTLADVGRALGLTRARAWQIEQAARERVREMVGGEGAP